MSNQLIQKNVPLNDKNWFKTGGNTRFFAQPHDVHTLHHAVQFAQIHQLPLFLLGHGANILISDDGFDGIVIRPALNHITINPVTSDTAHITAGAGVAMPELIEFCLNNYLLGLEEFSGIPGTVGGSVYINLHYFNFLISQFLVSARIIDYATGEITSVTSDWFQFGYNYSRLHERTAYLVDATFALKIAQESEVHFARGRRAEIIRHRANRYPQSHTCGSFFRNFFDHEVHLTINNKKMIYVAYYLDKIGVKGILQHGDAHVSYQHANMIVNRGNATSTDIINVARRMQELVLQHFNILPQPECIFVGFKQHPLL